MKILHLGYSDKLGGASIAMMRLHRSLKQFDINSKVLVGEKLSDDNDVICSISPIEKKINDLKIKLVRQKKYFYSHDGKYSHSLNFFNSKINSKINSIKPDLVNIHWVNNELISIKQISEINLPVVWTFNDMWPMCGGEHYTDDDRFKLGYNNVSKRQDEKGFDLNKYLWVKKNKYWKSKINHIICISKWLKNKAKESHLFKKHQITFIPCTIDEKDWNPVNKNHARESLNLPRNKIILLFMSTNGVKDYRKGFKFIKHLLDNHLYNRDDIIFLNVGKNKNNIESNKIINVNKSFNGNPEILRKYYSASDCLLTPSSLEAFGQVAIEAASCGTPAIGFEQTGLEDTIIHKNTGYLAKYLNQEDFNFGLDWIINKIKENKDFFKNNCQNFAKKNFSSEVVAKQYIDIYKSILKK